MALDASHRRASSTKELTREFTDKLRKMSEGQIKERHHEFQAQGPKRHIVRLAAAQHDAEVPHKGFKFEVGRTIWWQATTLLTLSYQRMYLGFVAKQKDGTIDVGFSAHDGRP